MGLDIAFNRAAAIAAGLELITEARDPEGAALWPDDKEMQDHCNEIVTYVKVPDTNVLVEDGAYETSERIAIRANKWGSVYGPMTEWLERHGISWTES